MHAADPRVGVFGGVAGEIDDLLIGCVDAHQLGDVGGPLDEELDRVTDPGRTREPEQGLDRRQPGQADADGQAVALGVDPAIPGDDRLSLEGKLGDDVQLGAGPLGKVVLPRQRILDQLVE